LTWESKRIAGRLLKIFKSLREVDWGRRSDVEKCSAGRHPEAGEEQEAERGTEPPAVVSVVLDEDEDVEWIWTHTADGKSVVTGYIITKRPDKPRQQGAVSDDSNRTVPSGG
jgi:hypothetical protein